ncbi:MAG: DUF2252 domain-containing protein [Acidimicrobiales bacterium]|jgi:uncharacterized protein (DUF2252 family)|nr:DUF2252 domain-containing protein [Acidimicrobiales bacterium]
MTKTANPPLPDPEYLPKRPAAERTARGVGLRVDVPLGLHANWSEASGRTDPVDLLERQAEQRIPELIPIRHGRMLQSPFAFFRGGAAIMAADLAGTPVSGLRAQLCGDAHLLNFGIFDTPERSLVFGLNDFDETLPGPFEWDVKRLAASMEIAGRDLGFDVAQREEAVRATVRSYRESMAGFAEMRNLDVWYAFLPASELRDRLAATGGRAAGKEVAKRVTKALQRDHLHAFERYVRTTGTKTSFLADPPVLVPADELLDDRQRERYVEVVREFLRQYRDSLRPDRRMLLESYRFVEMARKVVGVGSVGTRAWVVLLIGRDASDPLLLQLKEAQPSVLAPYAGPTQYDSEGHRVVEGQRLMQTAPDHLLGWYRLVAWDGVQRDFYVRQLWDGKASIDVTKLSAKGLRAYGVSCGWTLARAHARSGDRLAMAAYLGDGALFDDALVAFAAAYADTNERDHARLRAAVDAGRVEAITGI